MNEPLVTLRGVSAGYDGKQVLSDVSFDIYNADFVTITGPNGGGKTTLLRVILGLLPHSAGSVQYADNLIVNGVRKIGYLPQHSIFDRSFPISVGEVVLSGLQGERGFRQRYSAKDVDSMRNLLKTSDLQPLETRPIGEISGGQMQRALLCRALIASPKLLILDEPTTYVDSRFESELIARLAELNRSGMAIAMVSHNVDSITHLAKKIVHIERTIKLN